MKQYPVRVDGKHGSWESTLDADSLIYWNLNDITGMSVVGLVWLDTVEGEEGDNPEGDCWCVCLWEDAWAMEAGCDAAVEAGLEGWSESCMNISDVMRRADAEKWLYDYMETH